MTNFRSDKLFAVEMDKKDLLNKYKNKFHLPKHSNGEESLYFAGNSLGLMPKTVPGLLSEELEVWETMAVKGHTDSKRPWKKYEQFLTEKMADIVGTLPSEIAIMNALTVNLNLLLVSFYHPTPERHKILVENKTFPSDLYAFQSQIKYRGFNPEESLLAAKSKTDSPTIATDEILEIIESEGDSIAVVLLGGVNYFTGQAFNMKSITKAAHKKGCIVGFDLAHAVGNILLNLHDWNVDFAAWCNYKYLNAGPGSVGGIFVHENHAADETLQRFSGWWGHNRETRFQLSEEFDPMPGAGGWQISNPPIFSTTPLLASLEIFNDVGMKTIWEKSVQLTGYFEFLLKSLNSEKFTIITPENPDERGAQLSIFIPVYATDVFQKLNENGVVCDLREPDVIRASPVPLYNSFEDVYRFVENFSKLI